jgi:endonuclease/exonuclease/phosphatase family metal-dependent hydrolase
LADSVWPHFTYGKNAIYQEGHHGNAILSRFPITSWCNTDISHSLFEDRGLLHGKISGSELGTELHVLCTHLGLFEVSRRKQYESISRFIEANVPSNAPLILAGDFNDLWKNASASLNALDLREVFETAHGRHARTFPSRWPLLALDRIYVRGVEIIHAECPAEPQWRSLSDHLPLSAELLLPSGAA